MEDRHFINKLSGKKKKHLKLLLEKQKELRKSEWEKFNQLLIYPLQDVIKTIDKVLKSELPIEAYIKRSEQFNRRVKQILKK